MIDLSKKKGVVLGVLNDRSIGWGVVESLASSGADIGITYLGDRIKRKVEKLADNNDKVKFVHEYDASSTESAVELAARIQQEFGSIDFIVHSIAYINRENLEGDYYNTNKDDFMEAIRVSSYSFIEVVRECEHLLNERASLMAMTYVGATQHMPNYNAMGVVKAALESSVRCMAMDLGKRKIRVNAISAGPIKTLAASGISNVRVIRDWTAANSMLQKGVTKEDVGDCAVMLISDGAKHITGQVVFVDSGINKVGMINVKGIKETFGILQSIITE